MNLEALFLHTQRRLRRNKIKSPRALCGSLPARLFTTQEIGVLDIPAYMRRRFIRLDPDNVRRLQRYMMNRRSLEAAA